AVGSRPLGLDFSADGTLLYVANSGGAEVSVVDVALRKEVRRITVPQLSGYNDRPYSIAVANNGTALVTTMFDGAGYTKMRKIDLATETVTRYDALSSINERT